MHIDLTPIQALALCEWTKAKIMADPTGCVAVATPAEWQAFANELRALSLGERRPLELPPQILGLVLNDPHADQGLRELVRTWLAGTARA